MQKFSFKLKFISFFLLLFFFISNQLILSPLSANITNITDLGKIERDNAIIVRHLNIIHVPEKEILPLLNKAFNMHGSLQVSPISEAEFLLDFQQNSPQSLTLNIKLNPSQQIVASCTIPFTNSNSSKLTNDTPLSIPLKVYLKAVDFAVEQITGCPGFFAGTLAFVGERSPNKRNIYVSDILFYQAIPITHESKHNISPSLSPLNQDILFTTYAYSNSADIFKINLHTHLKTPFATYVGMNICPKYSPSGNQVAMVLSGKKGIPSLYISDIYGNNKKRITPEKGAVTTPSWSPTADRIIFSWDVNGPPQLFTVSTQSPPQTPQKLPITLCSFQVEPSWNPLHQNLIAFTYRMSGAFKLGLFDFTTNQSKPIPNQSKYEALEPFWLPDGRHLLYTQRNGYKLQLHILDSLSGKSTPLHSDKFGNTSQSNYIYQ